jgi:polysaccharide export outer membrane protein
MMGTKTLLEALADAGSPTTNSSNEVEVTHTRRPDGTPLASGGTDDNKQIVDLKDLLSAQAFILRDGDIVTVPKAQALYINGEVKSQGILVWQRGMTLTQAVTLSGGLTDRGTYRGATATRTVKGKTTEVKLDQQSLVLPDDVIKINKRLF